MIPELIPSCNDTRLPFGFQGAGNPSAALPIPTHTRIHMYTTAILPPWQNALCEPLLNPLSHISSHHVWETSRPSEAFAAMHASLEVDLLELGRRSPHRRCRCSEVAASQHLFALRNSSGWRHSSHRCPRPDRNSVAPVDCIAVVGFQCSLGCTGLDWIP
jgi:hypothetical protein